LCAVATLAALVATGGGGVLAAPPAPARTPPSVVFLLLDTTRADRFGAWGNPRRPTPHLDALARDGARFARHYANAHATRPSMPQLMSGRYHHPNILLPFRSLSHPREYEFLDGDAGAGLLPRRLREHGYHTVGVSAHPWVVADSAFGRGFERLDFLAAEPRRGHVAAAAVVDRALELWAGRPRDRPTFLYLHLMDLHMPRWLPERPPRAFLSPAWAERFSPGSHPLFGEEIRAWDRADAHDFTAADKATFVAFYDTVLAYTDAEIGRLIAAVREEDPGLRSVLVVVTADHGEELGEEGRTEHTGSLADGVQHIPLIVAGAGVQPGQRLRRPSQNVDVLPTLLRLLGLDTEAALTDIDGRPLVDADGRLCPTCAPAAVFYSWVNYDAVRSRDALLRLLPPDRPQTRCEGRERMWQLEDGRRTLLGADEAEAAGAERLRRRLRALENRRARFEAHVWAGQPRQSFFVPATYWAVGDDTPITCTRVGPGTTRADIAGIPGWQYARGSFFVTASDGSAPLEASVAAPDGVYEVEVGLHETGRPPRFFGFDRWLRRAFRRGETERFVGLGTREARAGTLRVSIPEAMGRDRRLLTLRLTPPGVAPATQEDAGPRVGPDDRERLRALGYLE
jgi:arylsulfatase A-like enzyme